MAVQPLQFGHSGGSFEATLVDGRDTLLKLDVVDLPVSWFGVSGFGFSSPA